MTRDEPLLSCFEDVHENLQWARERKLFDVTYIYRYCLCSYVSPLLFFFRSSLSCHEVTCFSRNTRASIFQLTRDSSNRLIGKDVFQPTRIQVDVAKCHLTTVSSSLPIHRSLLRMTRNWWMVDWHWLFWEVVAGSGKWRNGGRT